MYFILGFNNELFKIQYIIHNVNILSKITVLS